MNKLYELLKSLITADNTLTLTSDLSDGAFGLLTTAFASGTIVVRGCEVVLNGGIITITGSVSFDARFNGCIFGCSIRLEEIDGFIESEADLSFSGELTVSEFFGKPSQMLTVADSIYQMTDSPAGELILVNPVLVYRRDNPYLTGIRSGLKIPSPGRWLPYMPILGSSGSLTGTLRMYQTFCEYDLKAAMSGGSLPIRQAVQASAQPFFKTAAVALLVRNSVMNREPDSAAGIEVTFEFEGMSPMSFRAYLFRGMAGITVMARFPDGLGAFDIMNFFLRLFQISGGGNALLLPENWAINNFKLYELTLSTRDDGDGLSLQYIKAYLSTAESWPTPLNFLTLESLSLMWEMQWGKPDGGFRPYLLNGMVQAALTVDLPGGKQLKLNGLVTIPDLEIEAHLSLASGENVTDLIGRSAAATLPDNTAGSISLAALDLTASGKKRELRLYAELNAGSALNFKLGGLTVALAKLYAEASLLQSGNTFTVGGVIDFGEPGEADSFAFALEGSYTALKSEPPYWSFRGSLIRGNVSLASLIRRLLNSHAPANSLNIALTAFDISYTSGGSEGGSFSLLAWFNAGWTDLPLGIDVEAYGQILLRSDKGQDSTLSVLLGAKVSPFAISLQIDRFPSDPSYIFTFAFRDHRLIGSYASVNGEKVLSVGLSNVTLYDIIAFMVEAVNPNRIVNFPPPWDFLKKIDLSRFSFSYNFTTKALSVEYRVDMNILGLFRLNSIGLTYIRQDGKPKVLFRLNTDSVANGGLEWNLLESNTPGLVNKQNIFKLSFLAIGQHVSDSAGKLAGMNEIIVAVDYLRSAEISYSDSANWLFAADFTINSAFRARALLLDPHLYGIAITINGKNAPFGSLDGLMLELLYKKVSKSVGMFKATLILPQKFRRFTIGYATVVLGRISFEIYTNGDFLIDFGFPHGCNFSNSFSIEFGIFSGTGGFYFGKLSGQTATGLPPVSNGYYAPVYTFGIGLSIGLGRSFDIGIVSAGASLQAVGIFEGIFASYNLNSNAIAFPSDGADIDPYYKASALLGVTGRVYVTVDLFIIKLSASLELSAYARVQFESKKPTLIDLDLKATLRGSVRILFVKVKCSFDLNLHMSFTVSNSAMNELPEHAAPLLAAYKASDKTALEMDILPFFSLCENGQSSRYVLAFLPVMDNPSFRKLAALLADWLLSSLPDSVKRPSHMAVQNLSNELTYEAIDRFLSENVIITIRSRSGAEPDGVVEEGTVFAMPKPLSLLLSDENGILLDRSYSTFGPVSDAYIERLHKYFSEFDTVNAPRLRLPWNGAKPIAEVIFTDYFNMIMRRIARQVEAAFECVTVDKAELDNLYNRYGVQLSDILPYNAELKLNGGLVRVAGASRTASESDSLGSLALALGTGVQTLFEHMADKPVLRRTTLEVNGYEFANGGSLTLIECASLFYTRFYGDSVDKHYQHYVDEIYQNLCLILPDAPLDWEETTHHHLTVKLSGNLTWLTLPGDTVERLAKIRVLLELPEGIYPGFDEFKEKLLNGRNPLLRLNTVTIPNSTVETNAASPAGLHRRLCPDGQNLNLILDSAALKTGVALEFGELDMASNDSETIRDFCSRTGVHPEQLHLSATDLKEGQKIAIRNAVTVPKERLGIYTDEFFDELGASVSSFMLQGLRLPAEDSDDTKALYEVTGQQIPFTFNNSALTLELNCSNTPWLSCGSAVTYDAETISQQLPALNFTWTDRLTYEVAPPFISMPAHCRVLERLTIDRTGCVLYKLDSGFEQLENPSLATDSGVNIACTFGAFIPFEVRKTSDPDVLTVVGAPPSDRERLLGLTGCNEFSLYYRPSDMSGVSNTLIDLEAGIHDRFIKQNLSRETRMFYEYSSQEAEDEPVYASDLSDGSFLTLLWQCSVVCGGYLMYLKPSDSPRVPDSIFDEDNKVTLWLWVKTGKAESVNCALSDAAAMQSEPAALYSSNGGSFRPALDPGCVGAYLTLRDCIDSPFTLLGYGDGVKQSRPVIGEECGGKLVYRPVWALHRLAGSSDPYDAKPTTLEFNLRDVLGNLAPGRVTRTAVPAVGDFMVAAHELPFVNLTWEPSEGGMVRITLSCCETDKPSGEDMLAGVFLAYCQAKRPDFKASVSGHALNGYATFTEQLYNYLRNPSSGLPGSIHLIFALKLDTPLTRLSFSLALERNAATAIERAKYAFSSIQPNVAADDPAALRDFAKRFRSFVGPVLARSDSDLYAVNHGDISVSGYDREQGRFPVFYALKPLCNSPLTRQISVLPFNSNVPEVRVFSNIDLEVWVRHLLEDTDHLLSSVYASHLAAAPLDDVRELLAIKELLASNIAKQLMPIEKDAPDASANQREPVCAWLKDVLRSSLYEGYDISSIAQYKASYNPGLPLRLVLKAGGSNELSAHIGKLDANKTVLPVGLRINSRYRTGVPFGPAVSLEHLEYDISDAGDGYQTSRWLQFIDPPDMTEHISLYTGLPVPNPLRELPEPSKLVSHSSESGNACHLWHYCVSVSTTAAMQDKLTLSVAFSDTGIKRTENTGDLFDALAQYETVREPLNKALDENPAENLADFNRLLRTAAERWNLNIKTVSATDGSGLTVEITQKFNAAGGIDLMLSGYDKSQWTVEAAVTTDVVVPGKPFEFAITVKDLPLYVRNIATPTIQCMRNTNLLNAGGTSLAVDSAFLYSTEPVSLPPLYASVERSQIEAGSIKFLSKTDVLEAQRLVSDKLGLAGSDCVADVTAHYSYKFGNVRVKLPVCILVDIKTDSFMANGNAARLVADWYDRMLPITDGGALLYDVKITAGSRTLAKFDSVQISKSET